MSESRVTHFIALAALLKSHGWTTEPESHMIYADAKAVNVFAQSIGAVITFRDPWAGGYVEIPLRDMSYGLMVHMALSVQSMLHVVSAGREGI